MKRKILLLFFLAGCLNAPHTKLVESRNLMDTQVTISVYAQNEHEGRQAVYAAFTEMSRVERIFNTYDPSSEASRLNAQGFLENPSKDLRYVLNKSIYISQKSEGAFDVTVQPILDLYTESFAEKKRPPTKDEINEALDLVDYKKITLNASGVFLEPGMKLTFGGVAKGYAVDKALETLREHGIENALVDAGGDMKAVGRKPGGAFRVALQNPRNNTQYITIITLLDEAVATSGDYERYFINKSIHHIVNPKTGESARGVISATVLADEAVDADALATAIFVLGPNEGVKLAEDRQATEVLLITEDKQIIKSQGFKNQ